MALLCVPMVAGMSFRQNAARPSFIRDERPTHIVPSIKGAVPWAAKTTARNIWNQVRGGGGGLSIPPRARRRLEDIAPTMEGL